MSRRPTSRAMSWRRLRVLHLIDSAGVYGAESVLLDLCCECRALGHDPIIGSIGRPQEQEKPLETAARLRQLPIQRVPMAPGPNPAGAWRLLDLARTTGADVIHSHGYKPDILLALMPRRLRSAPLVITVHGYTHIGWRDRQALYARLDRLALSRADRVVLVHEAMASKLRLRQVPGASWRVIENGIKPAQPGSEGRVDPQIVSQIKGRRPVIGGIGRLSPEKGFDVLLRAAAIVLASRPGGILILLGEGAQRRYLERLAEELGIAGQVVLPGYVPHARDYIELMDCFVLPSFTEGLPLTLLEALQSGVPVVATGVGGVPYCVEDKRTGLLMPPGRPDLMAGAVAQILDHPRFARSLADQAKSEALTRFSSRAMAAQYSELYEEVASR